MCISISVILFLSFSCDSQASDKLWWSYLPLSWVHIFASAEFQNTGIYSKTDKSCMLKAYVFDSFSWRWVLLLIGVFVVLIVVTGWCFGPATDDRFIIEYSCAGCVKCKPASYDEWCMKLKYDSLLMFSLEILIVFCFP